MNKVQRYNGDTTRTDWFKGANPAQNFALNLGAGVIVVTGNGGSGFAWAHY